LFVGLGSGGAAYEIAIGKESSGQIGVAWGEDMMTPEAVKTRYVSLRQKRSDQLKYGM